MKYLVCFALLKTELFLYKAQDAHRYTATAFVFGSTEPYRVRQIIS